MASRRRTAAVCGLTHYPQTYFRTVMTFVLLLNLQFGAGLGDGSSLLHLVSAEAAGRLRTGIFRGLIH